MPTIISRCQIYDFERMDVPKIVGHLKMVAQKEGIQYEEEALSVIAEKADGGMRDALSIFDQCASYSQGNLTYEKVLENLNVLDSDYFFRIVDLCLDNNVSETMVLLNDIISRGFDGGHLINGLAKHLRSVMMASDPHTLPLLEVSERQRQRFAEQAKKCPVKFLYHALRFCNQCDISFRQSNNKRLLVELTLIEIGQITQEETPPGGRRPTRRLKSLFHQLVANSQQQATAAQVAATKLPSQKAPNKPVTQPTATVSVPVSKPATENAPASPNQTIPHRTTGGIFNGTFQSLLNTGQQKTYTVEPEITNKEEKKQFTQDDLLKEWFAMCNRMPQAMVGIASRLKHVTPKIADYPNIELVVDNQMLLDQIENIKGRIRKTMALALHNGNINFNIRLAEAGEIKPILSKREIFEKMRENNSAIEQLRTLLDLEMA